MKAQLLAISALSILCGCDLGHTSFTPSANVAQTGEGKLGTGFTVVKLSSANVSSFTEASDPKVARTSLPSGGSVYLVGVGDILEVVVWDHPELTSPAGVNRTPEEAGLRVQANGTFFYPYVGQIEALGRTPEKIRDDLTGKLAAFIPNPQVEVRVVGFKSQAVSVTGEVSHPLRQPLTDVPLTLLDAISAAGGLTDGADTGNVTVRRGGNTYSVNLQAFLKDGIGANNPVLQSGDVVNVPKLALREAYLLGQVTKPSTIDLSHDPLTLTQALTRIGGLREDSADARGVFVFRSTAKGVTVFQLDVTDPASYLVGTHFAIQPQDVIYVTSAPLYRWNRLISSLLPTLNVAGTADRLGKN